MSQSVPECHKLKEKGFNFMIVKSVNTRELTKTEIEKLEDRIKEMTAMELRKFRESFDADEMGFSGRKEGV